MESLSVERLDHLGILSEVIKDLGLIRLIDARLVPDELEEITPGEAVAGMMLHSVGFSDRPRTLPPSFLPTNPWTCCFVRASRPRCAIGSNAGARAKRCPPMAVMGC